MRCLKLEWERIRGDISGKKVESLYFGGGTPSLLGPEYCGEILDWCRQAGIVLSEETAEVTLEANPDDISSEKMRAYAAHGINRASIGVQSLDDALLQKLSRVHSAEKAKKAVRETHAAGIRNISIDLMYDLPGQTLVSWKKTLDEAFSLPISHVSLYNLTFEPHTVFYKWRETLAKEVPDPYTSLAMYEAAVEKLMEAGFRQYEISAFERGDCYSRHNIGYWTGRPFLGLGPSAFSYWNGKRFRNVCNLSRYAKALEKGESPVDFEEELQGEARLRELLAVHMRVLDGIDLAAFEGRYGKLEEGIRNTIRSLVEAGFLQQKDGRVALTQRGILFYDTVAEELI